MCVLGSAYVVFLVLAILRDGKARVVSAKAEGVTENVLDFFLADFAVKVELVAGVSGGQVGCSRNDVQGDHPDGNDGSDCSGCADEMAELTLDAGRRRLACVFTKGFFDCFGFKLVVVGR